MLSLAANGRGSLSSAVPGRLLRFTRGLGEPRERVGRSRTCHAGATTPLTARRGVELESAESAPSGVEAYRQATSFIHRLLPHQAGISLGFLTSVK